MTNSINDGTEWDEDSNQSMSERRGQFLLVLAILSWVWIGISVLTNLTTYIGGIDKFGQGIALYENEIEKTRTESEFAAEMMEGSLPMMYKTLENFTPFHLISIAVSLFGGITVFLMFKLKSIGFWLYLIYCIGIVLVANTYIGGSTMASVGIAFDGLFSLAFIIMYGVNLKRMTL